MITPDWLTITPSNGNGDAELQISTELNEGIDREGVIRIEYADTYKEIAVSQTGLREIFLTSDEFVLSDGGTYNVLKRTF